MWSALALAPEVCSVSSGFVDGSGRDAMLTAPLQTTSMLPDPTVHGGCAFAHLHNMHQLKRGQMQHAFTISATGAHSAASLGRMRRQAFATRTTSLLPIPEEGHVRTLAEEGDTRTQMLQPRTVGSALSDRGLQLTPGIGGNHHLPLAFAAFSCATIRPESHQQLDSRVAV